MIVWVAMALLTGAAVLAVLLPLARAGSGDTSAETATDAAFYQAQLDELKRDAERGLIDPAEAEVARIEAARRLLAANRRGEAKAGGESGPWRRRAVAAAAVVGVPLLSLGLYLAFGQPDLPDQPLAARTDKPATDMTMAEAIARIEGHLAKEPGDGRGYEIVGPVYMSVGRYDDAVHAFASAARLLGETPVRLENWGEATVAAADGVVTAEAKALFEKALAGDPKRVKARFYKGVAAEQDGDRQTALAVFGEIATDLKGSPLSVSLAERIKAMGGTPPEGTLVQSATPPQTPPDATTADPSRTDAGQAVASLPPEERMKMIRGMVDGLSQRLAENGSDVEGWLRLVRSYAVLNEPEKARDALARGRAALETNADELARLDALARDLNIGGS